MAESFAVFDWLGFCILAETLGFSFSTLLVELFNCFLGVMGVRRGFALICLVRVVISAYRFVLLRTEICPRVISELVQSRKGLIYDASSSVDLRVELLGVGVFFFTVKHLSKMFSVFSFKI